MPEAKPSASPLDHLLYSGSVKDVYGAAGRDPYVFRFSDRYSIFDWGEMPDSFEGKGEALAVMGDLFFRHLGRASTWADWEIPAAYPVAFRERLMDSATFRLLREKGLPHHSIGLVDEEMNPISEGGRSKLLAVKALQRPPVSSTLVNGKLHWNYSAYASRPRDVLVPLEVVFRFGAPEGSSFLERLGTMPGYAEGFGFTQKPKAGDWFPYPVVEYFTKLEPTDRFLSREEAMSVASLTAEELEGLADTSLLIALRLKDLFAASGLELWDGKFEFAFVPSLATIAGGGRAYQLVDSIGPDELRLLGPGGVHFSKEFLRRVYRGGAWYEAAEKAKKLAKERGEKDWKKICREELGQSPEKLPANALQAATELYPVLADAMALAFIGKPVFGGLPSVRELCAKMEKSV